MPQAPSRRETGSPLEGTNRGLAAETQLPRGIRTHLDTYVMSSTPRAVAMAKKTPSSRVPTLVRHPESSVAIAKPT